MSRAVRSGNLFASDAESSTPAPHPAEQLDTLLEQNGVSIERIVSRGHASPPGFWYDSPRAEFVVLLSGSATLEFEGHSALLEMKPGDHVMIDAHCRHRVAWTSDTEPSVWLAVYCPDGQDVNEGVESGK